MPRADLVNAVLDGEVEWDSSTAILRDVQREGVEMTSRSTVGLIPEIDLPILRELPKEGENIGLKPLGATVKFLLRQHPEWGLTTQELGGRLRSMEFLGLAKGVVVLPTSRGKGWQRTKAGDHLLANEHKIGGKE